MTCTSGDVRVLIPDLAPAPDQLFTDDEIQRFISIYKGNAKRAAAAAIDAIAVNEALLYKVVRTDDLSVNGVTGAEMLHKRAVALREEADNDDLRDGDDAFLLVPTIPESHAWPEASARGWRW